MAASKTANMVFNDVLEPAGEGARGGEKEKGAGREGGREGEVERGRDKVGEVKRSRERGRERSRHILFSQRVHEDVLH